MTSVNVSDKVLVCPSFQTIGYTGYSNVPTSPLQVAFGKSTVSDVVPDVGVVSVETQML